MNISRLIFFSSSNYVDETRTCSSLDFRTCTNISVSFHIEYFFIHLYLFRVFHTNSYAVLYLNNIKEGYKSNIKMFLINIISVKS